MVFYRFNSSATNALNRFVALLYIGNGRYHPASVMLALPVRADKVPFYMILYCIFYSHHFILFHYYLFIFLIFLHLCFREVRGSYAAPNTHQEGGGGTSPWTLPHLVWDLARDWFEKSISEDIYLYLIYFQTSDRFRIAWRFFLSLFVFHADVLNSSPFCTGRN